MKPVGYLTYTENGYEGKPGSHYDYIMAGNGLWIRAEGKLLAARIPIRAAEIRGLSPLEPAVVLRHGNIPQYLSDLAIAFFLSDINNERYIAIIWEEERGEYHLFLSNQAESIEQLAIEGDRGRGCEHGVTYVNPIDAVIDLHSHGKMPAEFSLRDNRDEAGLRLYGVVGELDSDPVIHIRVGIYGYFMTILWSDVFDGCLTGARDWAELDISEQIDMEEKLYHGQLSE